MTARLKIGSAQREMLLHSLISKYFHLHNDFFFLSSASEITLMIASDGSSESQA
jgi:hypothetical protein